MSQEIESYTRHCI